MNRWQHNDIQNVEDLSSWTSPELVRDLDDFPVTFFELFMTDKLIHHICKGKNGYAAQKGNHTSKIEPNELKSFLAVLLLSGYIPYPRRFMYWKMSSDSRNTIVAFLFTRNSFLDVLQYLHLAENNNLNPSDKFSTVNPLFKMINESCLQNFIPEKNVSIDESMVPYYGRHGFKQYIQNKPAKFGYKLWVTATPLGYAIQFYPYAGKDELQGYWSRWLSSYDSNVKVTNSPQFELPCSYGQLFYKPKLFAITEGKWYGCYWYS